MFHKDTLEATRLEYAIEQKYLERRQKTSANLCDQESFHNIVPLVKIITFHGSRRPPPPPPQSGQVKQTP